MRSLISALYVLFGLLIITLTYFENFHGPDLIMVLGTLLFLYGLLNPYLHKFFSEHKEYWNGEKKE